MEDIQIASAEAVQDRLDLRDAEITRQVLLRMRAFQKARRIEQLRMLQRQEMMKGTDRSKRTVYRGGPELLAHADQIILNITFSDLLCCMDPQFLKIGQVIVQVMAV